MNKIAVVLSAYNGEKYIREQIESIINQSYSAFDLFIHDDGSTDGTKLIINEFEQRYDNIRIILKQEELKYPCCFIDMLKEIADYEFYAFSDQDDVWESFKLADAIACMERLDNSKANLYYTAVEYTDSNLQHIRDSRFAKGKYDIRQLKMQELLFGGEAMGMTFVFNNEAKRALLRANEIENFKDWFLKLYCAAFGTVYYNPKSSAKYRRHNLAVTNGENPSGKFDRYLSQIKEIFINKDTFDTQRKILNYIKTYCGEMMLDDNEELIKLFLEPDSFKNRLRKATWRKRFRSRFIDELGYRLAFLLGRI